MSLFSNGSVGKLVSVNPGLDGVESAVVPVGGEVKREAAPGTVQSRVGTLWMWNSYHTGVHGHRAATPSPACHKLHSTAFASCTLPGIDIKHFHLKHHLKKPHDHSNSISSIIQVNTDR